MVAMSVDYLPPDDHTADDDLDELLDLAAELAPPGIAAPASPAAG
jgi:hypothetical protein